MSLTREIWVWAITALTVAAVVIRPFRTPEALWAVLGAGALTLGGLLSWRGAWQGVLKGEDVYLFLTGMMLLSETARREGLFDWLAALAVIWARGSGFRLFVLIYLLGVAVTAVLSNDATAVVLTPAVLAVARAAKAPPGPYLFACALIANAASFLLPISNPANLVVFASHMPSLIAWSTRFLAPSLVAITVTFTLLAWVKRRELKGPIARVGPVSPLTPGGRAALIGLTVTALGLLVASGLDMALGPVTCGLGVLTAGLVLWRRREAPWPLLGGVSWSVLPLVAGLFVLVTAIERSGLIGLAAETLNQIAARSDLGAAALAGGALALADNIANNLPVGLMASGVLTASHASARITDAVLIGVDLGPNLCVSGSLATILWLAALRREGQVIGFWRFLKVGAVVMPPALILSLATRLVWP